MHDENKPLVFGFRRSSAVVGERKVGLDSCIIIDLIEKPDFFSYEESNIFGSEVYVHSISLEPDKEVQKVLVDKGYTPEVAGQMVSDFIRNNGIGVIERDPSNRDMVIELYRLCKKNSVDVHPPDSWIIADFKKNGINTVYSTNDHFKKACNLFGIGVGSFPTMDKKIGEFFRGTYGERHKTKRRRR